MSFHLSGRKVLVLGLGDTGLSMTRWLARQGAVVSVADTRKAPPGVAALSQELPDVRVHTGAPGGYAREDFAGIDLVAISPGVDPRVGELAAALKRGVPAAGDVELFARALQGWANVQRAPQVLAITGSNGKSTVTAMCGAMCEAAGRNTVVAGNIGLPVLDVLTQIDDAVRAMPDTFVLELSSFQLETITSLKPAAAAMLNLSEDHLDRYDSYADYGKAKARIFDGGGVQVLNRDDEHSLAMRRAGQALTTFGLSAPLSDDEWGLTYRTSDHASLSLAHGARTLLRVDELPLAGLHNAANALAAGALCDAAGVPADAIARALRGFKGLPHRKNQ
jgi:UDP-N-acetylmuramoylalanine--D-glutamate ligase